MDIAFDAAYTAAEVLEGGAGSSLQKVGAGIIAGEAAGIGYLMSKRTRTTMDYDQVESALTRNNEGGPGGKRLCQNVNIKRGRKKRKLAKLMSRIERAQHVTTFRWQSLTDTPDNAYQLAHFLSFYETGGGTQYLPVYAFNLSAFGKCRHNYNNSVVNADHAPFYRLTKNSSSQYRWIKIEGRQNSNTGVDNRYTWQLEDTNQNTEYPQVPDYTLDWVNARLMLQGADVVDSHIDVYEVNFLQKNGPLREFYDSTAWRVEDAALTGDEENNNTAWWDHYLASRICHPFRTSALKKGTIPTMWKIYRHKTITFGARTDSDNIKQIANGVEYVRAGAYRKCLNLFNRYDSDINLRSVNNYVSGQSGNIVDASIPQNPGYAQIYTNAQASMFQPPDRERWLVISAKTYSKSTLNDENPDVHFQHCSFDVNIRQKMIWSD